jgi:hypothetical protein
MDEPRTSSGDSQESATALFGHLVKVAVSETAVTWAVRRACRVPRNRSIAANRADCACR